jgi:predicted DNA-binding protein (UPF0251 family)
MVKQESEKKLSDRELLRRLDNGATQAELAKELGVTRQAINERLKIFRRKTTKAIVAGKGVGELVDKKLNSLEQLQKINADAHWLLDHLMSWAKGDPEAIQILERQLKVVRIGEEQVEVREVKFRDPRQLAVSVMSEIRSQLDLQLQIFKTAYSVQEAENFMRIVLETIGEVDPHARTKIIKRLNEQRPVWEAVRFAQGVI